MTSDYIVQSLEGSDPGIVIDLRGQFLVKKDRNEFNRHLRNCGVALSVIVSERPIVLCSHIRVYAFHL